MSFKSDPLKALMIICLLCLVMDVTGKIIVWLYFVDHFVKKVFTCISLQLQLTCSFSYKGFSEITCWQDISILNLNFIISNFAFYETLKEAWFVTIHGYDRFLLFCHQQGIGRHCVVSPKGTVLPTRNASSDAWPRRSGEAVQHSSTPTPGTCPDVTVSSSPFQSTDGSPLNVPPFTRSPTNEDTKHDAPQGPHAISSHELGHELWSPSPAD